MAAIMHPCNLVVLVLTVNQLLLVEGTTDESQLSKQQPVSFTPSEVYIAKEQESITGTHNKLLEAIIKRLTAQQSIKGIEDNSSFMLNELKEEAQRQALGRGDSPDEVEAIKDEIARLATVAEFKPEQCPSIFDRIKELRRHESSKHLAIDKRVLRNYLDECATQQRIYCIKAGKSLWWQNEEFTDEFRQAVKTLSASRIPSNRLSIGTTQATISTINKEISLAKEMFGGRLLAEYKSIDTDSRLLSIICMAALDKEIGVTCANIEQTIIMLFKQYPGLKEYLEMCSGYQMKHCQSAESN